MTDFAYAPPSGLPPILHRDGHILVVDKPAGLLSVPGRGADRADCLLSRLQAAFGEVLLVHRLDLDTSGLIIFARERKAQGALGRQFEARTVAKLYAARLWGAMSQDMGRVDLPLAVDWPNRPRQHVDHVSGRPAQTDWSIVSRLPDETRVSLRPLTGRSHQLRVHMAALGHPILGDTLYSSGAARQFPRLMLHAEMLALDHPATGQAMTFTSPAPF